MTHTHQRSLNDMESFDEQTPGMWVWNADCASRGALVTTAIGGSYLDDFVAYSLPFWKIYADTHDLAIVVIHDQVVFGVTDSSENGAWLKLLAPRAVKNSLPLLTRIVLLDTDIIINPVAPNIFSECPQDDFGVVSLVNEIPFDLLVAKKRMAFLRHHFYSRQYPLDSSLFATPKQEFEAEGLPPRDNFFCSGLVVVPQRNADLMASWFTEAQLQGTANTTAWEQTFLNHKVSSHGCHWLPYEYQAIWNFEMAIHHPSAYAASDLAGNPMAQGIVADTLVNNYFLHFAGSWHESRAWRNPPELVIDNLLSLATTKFEDFLREPATGRHVGKSRPNSKQL